MSNSKHSLMFKHSGQIPLWIPHRRSRSTSKLSLTAVSTSHNVSYQTHYRHPTINFIAMRYFKWLKLLELASYLDVFLSLDTVLFIRFPTAEGSRSLTFVDSCDDPLFIIKSNETWCRKRRRREKEEKKGSHDVCVYFVVFFGTRKRIVKLRRRENSDEQKWLTPLESISRRSDHYQSSKKEVERLRKQFRVSLTFYVPLLRV